MNDENDINIKVGNLPISTKAKVLYLTNCLKQFDLVKAQQENGINPPKIMLELGFVRQYYKINDLGERDMDLIVEELIEIGVIDGN